MLVAADGRVDEVVEPGATFVLAQHSARDDRPAARNEGAARGDFVVTRVLTRRIAQARETVEQECVLPIIQGARLEVGRIAGVRKAQLEKGGASVVAACLRRAAHDAANEHAAGQRAADQDPLTQEGAPRSEHVFEGKGWTSLGAIGERRRLRTARIAQAGASAMRRAAGRGEQSEKKGCGECVWPAMSQESTSAEHVSSVTSPIPLEAG